MDANNNPIEFEPMSKKIYKGLTSPGVDMAWSLCSSDILAQLVGPNAAKDLLPVPALEGSKVFAPFAVIMQTKVGGTKTLKYRGTLPALAKLTILSTADQNSMGQQARRMDTNMITNGQQELPKKFCYAVTGMSEQSGSLQQRSVLMSFDGVQASDVNLSLSNLHLDLVQHADLKDSSKIYIVYETLYCQNTSMSVTIANNQTVTAASSSSPKGPSLTDKLKKMANFKDNPVQTGNEKYVKDRLRPLAFRVAKCEVNSKTGKVSPVKFDEKKFLEMKWSL